MIEKLVEKIKNEKRRRSQIYHLLDYVVSPLSYYDFFTKDAFHVATQTLVIASFFKKKIVTSELLLFAFFSQKNEITSLLKQYGIFPEPLYQMIKSVDSSYDLYSEMKERFYGVDMDNFDETKPKRFSQELEFIIRDTVKNARVRFKSPIISSEMLFLTLMEDKTTRAYQIIQQMLQTTTNWYLLRYDLIKRIHAEESFLRTQIPINQQYFGYLFRLTTKDIVFKRLTEYNILEDAVFSFRNNFVSSLLTQDPWKLIRKEVLNTIKVTNFRRYSS
jgi:hypothetical protein